MLSQTEALDQLRTLLPTGSTVRTILRHVSRSGMSRSISLVYVDPAGAVHDLDYLAVCAGVAKLDRQHGGLKVGGCGMDMGYALVYSLSRTLYPHGHPCTGRTSDGPRGVKGCPSNDHSNGDRVWRKGKMHSDGGYALNHAWL